MELSRLMGGGTPLVTNVAIYSTATVLDGVILAMSANSTSAGNVVSAGTTTALGAAAIGITQVSTAFASADRSNVNAQNAYRFNIGTDGIPNEAVSVGMDWIPTCINADALYYASYSTSTVIPGAGSIGISASVGTVVTITSTTTLHKLGGFLMDGGNAALSSTGGTPTFNGQLRYIANAAADSVFGLSTAMNASTDSNIIFAGTPMHKNVGVNAAGDQLASKQAANGVVNSNLLRIDNYVKADNLPFHPLRKWVDDGLNGLTQNVLYSEIALTGHAVVIQAVTA